jgi:RND family efflux transporter MFP subunit
MNRSARVLTTVLVLAVVLAGVATWRATRGDDAIYATVEQGSIAQAIETTGFFQPVETTTVRGTVSGMVDAVAVRAGDRVESGDVVAALDRRSLEAAVEEATSAVVEAELAAAVAAEVAKTGGEKEVGEALVSAERASSARLELEQAETAFLDRLLLAPAAGTILEVAIAAGSPYAAGTPVAVIASDDLELAADLDQVDLPAVPLGASVRVVPDAFPALELAGTVVQRSASGTSDGGAVTFAIRVALGDGIGEAEVRPGMTAALVIPSVAVDDALLVPAEAIETVGRRSFVQVRRDGEKESVEVTLGLRQAGKVQIVAGDVHAGDRVRVDGG